MTIVESIVLGIIQGLTEFLPISSSGHLEIAKVLIGDNISGEKSIIRTVILHSGTACSILVIFKDDILKLLKGLLLFKNNEEFRFSLKIFLSIIPAAFVGFFWANELESLFDSNLIFVGGMLIITSLLLFLADKASPSKKNISFFGSVIIGLSQAIAILPGISRSGATISTSVLLGVDKEKSAKFSFLMVLPVIFGKNIKDLFSGEIIFSSEDGIPLIIGFLTSFIVGLFACKWMIRLVKNSDLKYFSYYCIIIGLEIIILSLIYPL